MKIVSISNVALVDHMGSDLTVVNTARVSFGKQVETLEEKDAKLIQYLAKHGHWSPFAHCFIQLRISAPIFVARQLVKHQVGLSWNEVSRRYVKDPPTLYVPDEWRVAAENVKQGSSSETIDFISTEWWEGDIAEDYAKVVENNVDFYDALIESGVCPEQARMVLPQSMMTEWIWSGSLMAFARVCKQRLDPHAQKETREVAEQINTIVQELYPHSWKALMEN